MRVAASIVMKDMLELVAVLTCFRCSVVVVNKSLCSIIAEVLRVVSIWSAVRLCVCEVASAVCWVMWKACVRLAVHYRVACRSVSSMPVWVPYMAACYQGLTECWSCKCFQSVQGGLPTACIVLNHIVSYTSRVTVTVHHHVTIEVTLINILA